MKTKTFKLLSISIFCVAALLLAACRDEEESPKPPPPTPPYGTGALTFTASDSVKFSVSGLYVPSTDIEMETNGSGAGGFLQDVVIGGRPLKGQVMAYRHSFSGGSLDDRVFFFEIYDSVGVPLAGNYNLVRPDTAAVGKFAVATYLFYLNSDGQYHVYQSKSGSVTVSTFDGSTNHLTGVFSGLLRGVPPDTALTIQIVHGAFDVSLGSEYFIYKPGTR